MIVINYMKGEATMPTNLNKVHKEHGTKASKLYLVLDKDEHPLLVYMENEIIESCIPLHIRKLFNGRYLFTKTAIKEFDKKHDTNFWAKAVEYHGEWDNHPDNMDVKYKKGLYSSKNGA